MMKKHFNLILLFLGIVLISACSGEKGDVSKDPKYADIANNIFITQQPLFYYNYTHSEGGKSGYFLSAETNMPNAELKAEIPVGSHVKVSKVIEVPQKDGSVQVMLKGDVFGPSREALKYMAMYEDIKPALKTNQ